MAEVLILTDNFSRANTAVGAAGTTTGAGNNWIDVAGAQWNIASNKLASANTNNIYRNWLLRPSTEDCADQRTVIKYTFNSINATVLLRANSTSYDSYVAEFTSGNQRLYLKKFNGAAQTQTILNPAVPPTGATLVIGTQYTLDAKVVGTTLTATLYKTSDMSVVQTQTVTDSSFTIGSYGLTHAFNVSYDQVMNYNESAPATTGYNVVGPSGGVVNVASSVFTVSLAPAGSLPTTDPTTFTPNAGAGSGTFSPVTLQLGSSLQQGTFTYTPTTSGVKTITVTNNGGFTTPAAISYTASAAPLQVGVISTVSQAPTALALSATATTGGTGTLTYQWYRSTTANFTPASATSIAGATSLSLTDTGLAPDMLYFYKLQVTDSLSATNTTGQYVITTRADVSALTLGFIGDSISVYLPTELAAASGGSVNTPIALQNMLSTIAGSRAVTIVNRAVVGSTTASWLPATGQYTGAKAAFAAAGVTHVFIMLGANDSKDSLSVSVASYLANMTSIVNDLTNSGYKIILNASTYTIPGSFSNDFSEASTARIQSYAAQLPSLINGMTVYKGDTKSYEYFSSHQSELVDGVHPKPQGVQSLARLWLQASAATLLPLGPLFINQGGIAKTLTPYKG